MDSNSRYPPEKCQKGLKSCPPGYEVNESCDLDEYRCTQCGPKFFQPNENRIGDKCRLKKVCYRPFMTHKDPGSTVKDSKCGCQNGYHFENEDQRACVPNRECDKGFGQGDYGVCERCILKMMYSDSRDRTDRCKPLKDCAKDNRCTKRKSNGTYDNICGPIVSDVNDCNSVLPDNGSANVKIAIIAGVVGVLLLLVVIIVIFICRRKQARKSHREPLTGEQLEDLKTHIVYKCEKDEGLCKKVISESMVQIESRIDKQYWSLAQALFRNHTVSDKYETVVDAYKDKSPRDAVKGYLREWKLWRGDSYLAVKELFDSLCSCKRDDIVYEVCNRLRQDVAFDDDDAQVNNRVESNFCIEMFGMFPCLQSKKEPDIEKCDKPETTMNLLDSPSKISSEDAGNMYRGRSYPSAPVLEEGKGLLTESEVHYQRQYSQPVQATS